jgi:thiamine biosynthesis lipoprotein
MAIDPLVGIVLDPGDGSIRLPAGMRLDLGGVAKGWAAHTALQRLERSGSALVDAGGDVAVGTAPDESYGGWPVGIADPFHAGQDLEMFTLQECGIATSGQDYRRWLKGGVWQHHLIDPRTGRPAVTDVLTATVVAPTVIQAEMAAKTSLILGSYLGLDWLEHQPGFSGLLVLQNENIIPFGVEDRTERNLSWLKVQ